MYNILTLNNISSSGTKLFNQNYSFSNEVKNPDAVLLRSTSMHDMEFNQNLIAIARAGAGVNNIPINKCSDHGIVVFNTPGANANAVKELTIAGLLMSSRKIVEGIEWTKSLKGSGDGLNKIIEKGKKAFAGPELLGKKLGVIGLGSIGALVANTGVALGLDVYGYDPYISIQSAWRLSSSIYHSTSIEDIFNECDYITLHIPLNETTKEIINKNSISMMKDGVKILNFSRGALVNSNDIITAVRKNKVSCYVTDFSNDDMISVDNIITIPHLGASTPESEDNCAIMACKELINYIEDGNIINSVNMPNIIMPRGSEVRVCVLHRNIPNMISGICSVLCDNGSNIENMQSKSRGDYAYAIIDITGNISEKELNQINEIYGVIKVRVIK